MRSITLAHVGYHYMNSRLIHDQTFTGYPDSLMGCTQSQRSGSWLWNGVRPSSLDGIRDVAQSALGQTIKGPMIFRHELLDDVPAFELRRKDFPGIGFHFQVRAQRGIGL